MGLLREHIAVAAMMPNPVEVSVPSSGSLGLEEASVAALRPEPPLEVAVVIPPAWADWPEAVWEELRNVGDPLTWSAAQKLASSTCRRLKVSYGRESKQRATKFREVMEELYEVDWGEVHWRLTELTDIESTNVQLIT